MFPFALPEVQKIVTALLPAADAAGRNGAVISLKNAHKVWVVVNVDQGNAATILLTIQQCTNVAAAGAKVLTNVVPIWANQDTATDDTLVRQANAVNFTTSAAVKGKCIVIEIAPETLDIAGGFDCIRIQTGASNAANITSAMYHIATRYQQATPPTAVAN